MHLQRPTCMRSRPSACASPTHPGSLTFPSLFPHFPLRNARGLSAARAHTFTLFYKFYFYIWSFHQNVTLWSH